MEDTAERGEGPRTAGAATEVAMEEDMAEATGEAALAAATVLEASEACPSDSPLLHRRPTRRFPKHSSCRLHRRLEAEEEVAASRGFATGVLEYI